jgi:hypothetical protein
LAGQENVNQKVFLFTVIFGFTAVWIMYLFFWITEQRHIREERILSMFIFVLFVNNNMWWKEEKIKLLLDLQTHPTRNIKQAYYAPQKN